MRIDCDSWDELQGILVGKVLTKGDVEHCRVVLPRMAMEANMPEVVNANILHVVSTMSAPMCCPCSGCNTRRMQRPITPDNANARQWMASSSVFTDHEQQRQPNSMRRSGCRQVTDMLLACYAGLGG